VASGNATLGKNAEPPQSERAPPLSSDEPDRFAKLALSYPDLLDHEEQRLWKLISECGFLWKGNYGGPNKEWQWRLDRSTLRWDELRIHWEAFRNVARGVYGERPRGDIGAGSLPFVPAGASLAERAGKAEIGDRTRP
jgi:hypothetical protein